MHAKNPGGLVGVRNPLSGASQSAYKSAERKNPPINRNLYDVNVNPGMHNGRSVPVHKYLDFIRNKFFPEVGKN